MPTSISTPHATSQRRPTERVRALLRRARRVLLGLTIALCALGGGGAVYQAVAAEGDRRAYPPPCAAWRAEPRFRRAGPLPDRPDR